MPAYSRQSNSPVDSPNCRDAGDGRNLGGYLAIHPANCACDLVRSRSRHRSPEKEETIVFSSRSIVKNIEYLFRSFFFFLFFCFSFSAEILAARIFSSAIKSSASGFLGVSLRTLFLPTPGAPVVTSTLGEKERVTCYTSFMFGTNLRSLKSNIL